MPRLRMVSSAEPGWRRRRSGRGFSFVDQHGNRLSDEDAERCRLLVIPPAWEDVWICPRPNGHLQAVGTDAAGRRQYLYHEEWRRRRDEAKHDRVLQVARRLPRARRVAEVHLRQDGMPYERVLATAFRLLDLGLFRVGGESYAEQNGSFGLATLRKQHVDLEPGRAVFDFPAKSGQQQFIEVTDEAALEAIRALRRRRGGGAELLAFRDGGRWRDVTSADINTYIKDVVGDEFSAKDFRTWHATVIAAVLLAHANDAAASASARRRAVPSIMRQVADQLGNTPAVVRSSYVDHRVVDLYHQGVTIAPKFAGPVGAASVDLETRVRAERPVLKLLS
ncbi:DNA topoisomerase IB [Microlunatus panaciterrae]